MRLLLEHLNDDACRWATFADEGQVSLPASEGSVADFIAYVSDIINPEVVVIVPSEGVQQRVLQFDAESRKHVLKTAKFELEDELAEDVDSLHFAYGEPGVDTVELMLTQQTLMQQWLQALQDAEINVVSVLPQRMALPLHDDTWSVLADEQRVTLNQSFEQGFSARSRNARLAWDISTRESDALPSQIHLYAESDAALQVSVDAMPQALGSLVQARVAPWFAGLEWNNLSNAPFNLLQGTFAPSIPWARLWEFWRKPMVLLLAVMLLFTVSEYVKNNRLQAENLRLRQAINKVYADTFPGSHISDPQQQMRGKLKSIQADGGGSRFIPLFYKSSEVIANASGLSLHSVNYDNRNEQMRVEVLAKQFQDIEKLRNALQEVGVLAELANSNSVPDGVRARMTFKEL